MNFAPLTFGGLFASILRSSCSHSSATIESEASDMLLRVEAALRAGKTA
jgi:hypothetical protein